MNKKISVLMGVYNCETTVEQSINSIIKQTYQNWELIICDDGSIDNTFEIVSSIAQTDKRIIVIRNKENIGLNRTLNNCLQIATGDYIARMDGDDDCVPERFEIQLSFLERNPQYDIVSSAMTFFDDNGDWGRNHVPLVPTAKEVVTSSPICHAPVMMRKKCMDAVGGYTEDKRMIRVEDVNLWIKLYTQGYQCYNIQQPLYKMRNDKNAFSRRKYKYRINSVYVRLKGCRELNLDVWSYVKAFNPMIIGLVPAKIRRFVKSKIQN